VELWRRRLRSLFTPRAPIASVTKFRTVATLELCRPRGRIIGVTIRLRHAVYAALILLSGACSSTSAPLPADVQFPLASWAVSQDFGSWNPASGGYHLAEDVIVPAGDSVFAMAAGIVRSVTLNNEAAGYGGVVLVEHDLPGETVTALYGHISSRRGVAVTVGETVAGGDLLAFVADNDEDGGPWPPHLHFGIRRGAHDSDASACGVWLYVGYTRDCAEASHDEYREAWYDPSDFLTARGAALPER
jgi:murein DD-endopeptidase MepM/ murein hydrolase activator NlpD